MWIRWFVSNKLKELSLLSMYDRFVVTRADHCYLCEHNLAHLNASQVWVPKGQDWGGITDRHVVAPSTQVLAVLDILPNMLENPLDFFSAIAQSHLKNPETLIQLRWMKIGIEPKRFDRMMFAIAAPGDPTRWSATNASTDNGLKLKYPEEYSDATCTCFNATNGKWQCFLLGSRQCTSVTFMPLLGDQIGTVDLLVGAEAIE